MWQAAVWCVAALVIALGEQTASAQSTLTWRPLGSYSGSNTWDTSTSGTYWFNGSTYDYWSSTSNTAAFGNSSTTGTTVLVSGSVGAAGLTFNTLSVTGTTAGATFTLTGGTIGLGTGATILVGGSTVYGAAYRPHTIASTLSGSNVTIDRVAGSSLTGGLRLSGTNTALTGTMTMTGPVLVFAGTSAIQNISTINFTSSSAAIDFTSGSYGQNFILTGLNLRPSSNNVVFSGTITLAGNGGFQNNQDVRTTFNNGIGETGGPRNLTLQLGGTTVLLGQSTYTGTTIFAIQNRGAAVSAVLLDGGNDRLPTGTVVQMNATTSVYGIVLGGTHSGSSTPSHQTIAGLTAPGPNSFIRGGASGVSTLTVNLASGTNTFAGILGGTAANANNLALAKAGAGTLALTGSNAYSGGTSLTAGTLRVGNAFALGSASGSLAVNGGSLNLNGFSVAVGALSGGAGGVITTSTNAGTATLTTSVLSGTSTYAGRIDNNGLGVVALVKEGSGWLDLSGSNTYGGLTTVSAGGLAVNGSLAGAVTVQSGATLGGSGTIEGAVSILAGGIIAPGNSPATLTVNDVFTLTDTSLLEFELNGLDMTIGGGVNDLITGVTDLTLDGILNVTALAPFTSASVGMKWRLFSYSGSLVDNTLALGTMPTLSGGNSFSIDTSEAGQVNLVIVPEPAGLLIAAVGLGVAGLAVARRKGTAAVGRRG